MFDLGDKLALYFKMGKEIPYWQTFVSYSFDEGESFSGAEELIKGDISGGRGPVKNKAIKIKSNRILAPASTEIGSWKAFIDISDNGGESFRKTEIKCPEAGLIQPTLWEDENGNIHALMRSNKGFIYRSDSFDNGETWCDAYKTNIPNNNSGIDLVKAEGKIYLVCNPVEGNWAARSPLSLFVSEDNGESFTKLIDLETEMGEFSYPAIISGKNTLYITYTYNRKSIVFTEINL